MRVYKWHSFQFTPWSLFSITCLKEVRPIHIIIVCLLMFAEDNWRLQAEERRALRPVEPQVDQMAPEVVLSVLLWPRLSGPQPGLPL